MNKKLFISTILVALMATGINCAMAEDAVTEATSTAPKGDYSTTTLLPKSPRPVAVAPKDMKHPPEYKKAKQFDKAEMAAKKAEFEKRLNLTDEQKKKIAENKAKDKEKIKPIMDSLKQKKEELNKVYEDTTISEEEKAQKISELRKDIKNLKAQKVEIYKANMKNFESILTDKQKAEFAKIKAEQKKEMEKHRKQFAKKGKRCHGPVYGKPVQPKPQPVKK